MDSKSETRDDDRLDDLDDATEERQQAPEPVSEPDPRPFEPWRYAKTARARALVDEITRHFRCEEKARRWRKRARKACDQQIFMETVEALVCDLAHLHLSQSPDSPKRIAISRSKRLLATGPRRYRAFALNEQLPTILDRMHVLGHLVQRKGDQSCNTLIFTDELGEKRERRMTTIAVGPLLVWRMVHHGITFADLGVRATSETIILKEGRADWWDKARPIDYDDTRTTRRYRRELDRYNASIEAADIVVVDLPHIDPSDRRLRRIFTHGSFESGGRFAGGFWMSMKREERLAGLRIGGEEVASIDFNGLYPRILYAYEGETPPDDDVYRFEGLEGWRKGMKRLLNARLFDRGRRKSKPRRTPKEIRERTQLYPEDKTIADLLAVLEEGHGAIAGYFGTGVGHRLQFVESQIMMKVLLHLKKAGIVGLPVHDCVIVPRSAVDTATQIMGEVTKEVVGAAIPVTVDYYEEDDHS